MFIAGLFLGSVPFSYWDGSASIWSMTEIDIIRDHTTRAVLKIMAGQSFGDMVKAVVDIERNIMAVGGELHADEEAVLLEDGSAQKNLWGINLYPDTTGDEWVEFDSMINLRPSQGNRSRDVEDEETRQMIRKIVAQLTQ